MESPIPPRVERTPANHPPSALDPPHDLLAQLVRAQRVPPVDDLARPDRVEEGEDDLLDAALTGHRHPVAAAGERLAPVVVDHVRQVDDDPLGVAPGDL